MLVGRESERRTIEPLMAGAKVGESGVLVMTGEAGIGKTALLDWVASTVTGMQVLRATGIEAEQQVPFGGLLQLLRPLLGLVETLPAPQADGLGGALALRAGTIGDRFSVGAGTLGLICRAAEQQPLVLLIDDAHLLDRPSADALTFAARRLLADAVLLVATVRTGEPCALLEGGLPTVVVEGLDRASIARLVGAAPGARGADFVDRLHQATGGNPLALLELSHDPERWVRLPPDAPVPVPATVALAVERETGRLDPAARRAVLIAAASGGELPVITRALLMARIDPAALERASTAGLFRISGERVQFRHPLVRSSVYRASDPQERRNVHTLLAGALPESDLERRAWHVAAAATGPDERAAALLERVAQDAGRRSADAVAVTAYERAARLSVDDEVGIGRLIAAGEAALLAGQPGRSAELLSEALDRAGVPAQRVRANEILGAMAARSGSLIQARDTLSEAATQAAAFDPELSVALLADAVNACFYLGDTTGAIRAAERVETLLAVGMSVRAQVLGLMAVGTARLLAGTGGMAEVRRSVALLAESGELGDDPRRRALVVLGPLLLREAVTGRELVDRAVEESRRRAAIGTLPSLLFHLARDDATTHRWPTAASEYHEAIRLAGESGQSTDRAAALAGLGWLEARQGRRTECIEHLRDSARLCDLHQIHLFRAWSYFGLGDLELGVGAMGAALRHYEALADFLDDAGIRDVDLSPDPERVEVLVRLGRTTDAGVLAAEYHSRAVDKGQPWALARAQRALAMCATDGEMDDRFAAALDRHADTLDEFERAKTLLAQGSRLRRARRRVAARGPLRAALEIFDALGAAPYAGLTEVELRATGEHSQRRAASLTVTLTPQELQIATMLADGRSTRETAAALFLSPKTVEYHLRHVYAKLDVHSRAELAGRLR